MFQLYCCTITHLIETSVLKSCMGVPIFMRGSPISYENWAPGVPKIILTWGPGSPNSYEIGDPRSPGSPISHDTGTAILIGTGVAGIWGPPDYGDPRPNITSDIGTGVTISLSDMRLPVVPIALAVWGSSVIWGSLALL